MQLEFGEKHQDEVVVILHGHLFHAHFALRAFDEIVVWAHGVGLEDRCFGVEATVHLDQVIVLNLRVHDLSFLKTEGGPL